jgi:hypothetical protein
MKKRCARFAVPSCAFVCFVVLFLFLPSHPVFKRSLDLIYLHSVLAARPIVTPGSGSSPVALLIPWDAANGNDANSGTSPSSPKTLTGADGATSPGSVVCLLGGRYELSDSWTVKSTGTNARAQILH